MISPSKNSLFQISLIVTSLVISPLSFAGTDFSKVSPSVEQLSDAGMKEVASLGRHFRHAALKRKVFQKTGFVSTQKIILVGSDGSPVLNGNLPVLYLNAISSVSLFSAFFSTLGLYFLGDHFHMKTRNLMTNDWVNPNTPASYVVLDALLMGYLVLNSHFRYELDLEDPNTNFWAKFFFLGRIYNRVDAKFKATDIDQTLDEHDSKNEIVVIVRENLFTRIKSQLIERFNYQPMQVSPSAQK